MSKQRVDMEKLRQESIARWAQANRDAMHESTRNTPVNQAPASAAGASGVGGGGEGSATNFVEITFINDNIFGWFTDKLPAGDINSASDWCTVFDCEQGVITGVTVIYEENVESVAKLAIRAGGQLSILPAMFKLSRIKSFIDNVDCVDVIFNEGFRQCGQLTYVKLNAVISSGGYCFYGCSALASVELAGLVDGLNNGFNGCTSLESISLPAFTSFSGQNAFLNCTSLITADIPNATYLYSGTFGLCGSMQSVNLPAVTTAQNFVFPDCTSLESIDMPLCTSLGNQCFQGCTDLISLSIPSCTNLGVSVGDNSVFTGIAGNTIALDVNAALMYNNNNGVDGDIAYLKANNTVQITTTPACAAVPLVGVNATITTDSAIKTSSGGWDASAYTTQAFAGPVSVSFRINASGGYTMGGFAYTPSETPDTYTAISYGFYVGVGNVEIYENGDQATNLGSMSTLPTDVWKVKYNGTDVRYYKNDVLLYTSARSVTGAMKVFFPMLTQGYGVTNVCISLNQP